jgi:ureidoglycolate hydrolase
MRLRAEPLSADAFAPFGGTIDLPGRAEDSAGPSWRWWAETVLLPTDGRSFGVGYLDLRPGARAFDWAERHMRTTETIVPLGGDCLVYAGPAEDLQDPMRLPPRDRFRVFRVRAGQGVVMHPGVWHGAPLAIEEPVTAAVLILEGTGGHDVALVRFEDDPIGIDL